MRCRMALALMLLAGPSALFGQVGFKRYDGVPVAEEGGSLPFPWAGGLNHPQFNNIDLNGDGIPDLVVFEKTGDRMVPFLMGEDNQLSLAPQYREMFINQHTQRPRLHDWVLMRDFNCDGRNDIFTHSNGGIAAYRNDSQEDTLIFTLVAQTIQSQYPLSSINLYVSAADLPAIMDVDGDGDIDIVTFSLMGASAEYHRNMSMELYGHCDSLVFVMEDPCWGQFEEDPSTLSVMLDVPCKGGAGIPAGDSIALRNQRHSGFTMLGLDLDGDGDKDLVLGNVMFNRLNALTNGGTAQSAHMTAQDATFPQHFSSTIPIDFYMFPAAFLADVNNDGKDDLIAASYQQFNANDHSQVWLYENVGTAEAPDFEFVKPDFLQDGMIDLGSGAYPAVLDVDGDGLLDLIVGNRGYFISTGNLRGQLAYYRNTGTAQAPAFTLMDRDYLSLSELGFNYIAPTVGDLDGDGDMDLLIGADVQSTPAVNGRLYYFENSGGQGNPCSFDLTEPIYQGINIAGTVATPCLFDLNNDGLLDLIIGEFKGKLHYLRNEGTPQSPQFVLLDQSFGGVDMRSPGYSFGASAPFLMRHEGQVLLVVGSEEGTISVFGNAESIAGGPENQTGAIGNGAIVSDSPGVSVLGTTFRSGRNQLLIKASELHAIGATTSTLFNLSFETVGAVNTTVSAFEINIGHTELESLESFVSVFSLSTCYTSPNQTITGGWQTFDLTNPFTWDGQSNLVVQVCWYVTEAQSADVAMRCSETGFNSNAFGQNASQATGCATQYSNTGTVRPNLRLTYRNRLRHITDFPAYEGMRCAPTAHDLDGDGLPELIIGNVTGGLAYYKGDTSGFIISGSSPLESFNGAIRLYPNPSDGLFVMEGEGLQGLLEIAVSDLQGRVLHREQAQSEGRAEVRLGHLPSGMYLLRATGSKGSWAKRVVLGR